MKKYFCLLSFFFILGCASEGDITSPTGDQVGTGQAATSTSIGRSLIGAWVTPCYPDRGNFFQQRIEFTDSGNGSSRDTVFTDMGCTKVLTAQESAKTFAFGITSESGPHAGQLRMQTGPEFIKDFEVKLEGEQTLLTSDGITLRLTKVQ